MLELQQRTLCRCKLAKIILITNLLIRNKERRDKQKKNNGKRNAIFIFQKYCVSFQSDDKDQHLPMMNVSNRGIQHFHNKKCCEAPSTDHNSPHYFSEMTFYRLIYAFQGNDRHQNLGGLSLNPVCDSKRVNMR